MTQKQINQDKKDYTESNFRAIQRHLEQDTKFISAIGYVEWKIKKEEVESLGWVMDKFSLYCVNFNVFSGMFYRPRQ